MCPGKINLVKSKGLLPFKNEEKSEIFPAPQKPSEARLQKAEYPRKINNLFLFWENLWFPQDKSQ